MKELQSRNYIIIMTTDKGGAVVFLDVNDYINEAVRQINNIYKTIKK